MAETDQLSIKIMSDKETFVQNPTCISLMINNNDYYMYIIVIINYIITIVDAMLRIYFWLEAL